jgi:hypothetical protein
VGDEGEFVDAKGGSSGVARLAEGEASDSSEEEAGDDDELWCWWDWSLNE